MASEVPITSNARAFEECSQLVNLIRYQLGDPTELLNNFCFRNGSAFALVDRRQIQCDDDQSYYRHTANFAWVLLETFFTGGVPEMRSPIFVPNGCYRRWQFVANYIRGGETIRRAPAVSGLPRGPTGAGRREDGPAPGDGQDRRGRHLARLLRRDGAAARGVHRGEEADAGRRLAGRRIRRRVHRAGELQLQGLLRRKDEAGHGPGPRFPDQLLRLTKIF